MLLALALATALQSAAPAPAITRVPLVSTPTLEAARVEFAAGAVEPPGNHGYDVVLVPIDGGISAEVDGAPAQWTPGIPILISRGAPHVIENRSNHPVRFVEVRTIGDSPAGSDRVASANDATIVRSTYGKYVRATVFRIEAGGAIEWPADVDALVVIPADARYDWTPVSMEQGRAQAPASGPVAVLAARRIANRGDSFEIVRISRMAPAR